MNPTVSQADWSLHRKGQIDQHRHDAKVREAIRRNLGEVVSRQDIITAPDGTIVKVPIRSLEEYKFRFDEGKGDRVGQGNGTTKVGDVIGRADTQGWGPGEAGEAPGHDFYEVGITIEELEQLIFEDLGLPNLEEKKHQQLESEAIRFTDVRRHGCMSNLNKRATLRANIKRNAMRGGARVGGFRSEDLRFTTWEQAVRHQSNAVVLAMMDVSGSMGEFEKYIARSCYFWMVRFLRTKYHKVEIVFIAHHTKAQEVTEHEFFTRGESGGTIVSSAYELALAIIGERYRPSDWNIYPFHLSDGDNKFSDNQRCVELIGQLLEVCNLFGFGQIKQGWQPAGTLLPVYVQEISHDRFVAVSIEDKQDIYPALRRFFPIEAEVAA